MSCENVEQAFRFEYKYNHDRPESALANVLIASDFCKDMSKAFRKHFKYFVEWPHPLNRDFTFIDDKTSDLIYSNAQILCYSLIWKSEVKRVKDTIKGYGYKEKDIKAVLKIFERLKTKYAMKIASYRRRITNHYKRLMRGKKNGECMKKLLFGFVLLSLVSCNNLKRLTEGAKSYPPDVQTFGDIVIVPGTTQTDFDVIGGVPSDVHTVSVKVKRLGETEHRDLNHYEFDLDSNSNSLLFKKYIILQGHLIIIPGTPAAPKGSEFEITAIRTG